MSNKNDKYGFTEGTKVDIEGEHVGNGERAGRAPRPASREPAGPPASRAARPVVPPPSAEPVDLESTRAMEMPASADAEKTVMMETPLVDKPKAYVTIVGGQDQGKEIPLRAASILVGRGLDCDLVLNDPSVSRKHFNLVLAGDRYKLVDLGSGNGTAVNGQRVRELVLEEGTELKAGTTVMRIGYGISGAVRGAAPPAPKDQTSTAHVPRPQPTAKRPTPPPIEIEDAEPVTGGGAGKVIAIAAVVILVLGGGTWFVGERFMGWWNLAGLAPTAAGSSSATASVDEAEEKGEEAAEAAEEAADEAVKAAEEAAEAAAGAGGDEAAAALKAAAEAQKAALEAAGAGGDAAAAVAAAQKAALEAAGAAGGDAAAAMEAAQKAALEAQKAALEAAGQGGDAAAAIAAAQKAALEAAGAAGGDAAAAMEAAQKAAAEAQQAALAAAGQGGDQAAAMADAMKAAAEAQKAALEAAGAAGGDAAAALEAAQKAAAEAQKAALAAAGAAGGDAAEAIAKANAAALAAAQAGQLTPEAQKALEDAQKAAAAGAAAAAAAATAAGQAAGQVDAAGQGAPEAGQAGQAAGDTQVAAAGGVPTEPTAADDDVRALFDGGLELTKDQRWDDALSKFEAVKAKNATYPGLVGAIARVKAERGFGGKLDEAKRKLGDGQSAKGLELLKSIPETSTYYVEATTLLTEARDDFVRDAMTRARAAVRNKNAAEARKAVKAALAEQSDHADAAALGKALDQGLPAAYKLVTGEVLEDKPKIEKPKAVRADFGGALSAYKAGRFDDAIASLESASKQNLSSADQSKAKDYIKAIKKFRNNYGEGRAAAKAFQAAAATAPLEKAYQADQRLGGHYSGELKKTLAEMNAYRAASYFAKNEYGTAAVFARKALSFDPSQQSASQVYSKSQEKAESLHQQGMAAWNAGNKALAGSFFRQVIKILPESSSSYKEAYTRLGQMEE